MIKELISNLINTLKTVPELEGRVGAVVGGTSQDPELMKTPIPFAWVIYSGNQVVGPASGDQYNEIMYSFTVIVGISYGATETDFLDTQITILDKVRQAVLGVEPYQHADQWKFDGCILDSAKANRLIYRFDFSTIGYHIQG